MSVTRLNEFLAKESHSEELYQLLLTIVPVISAAKGCLGCQLLKNLDEPRKFIIIEQWQSRQAHQLALKEIPADKFQAAMDYFESPPKGSYYQA